MLTRIVYCILINKQSLYLFDCDKLYLLFNVSICFSVFTEFADDTTKFFCKMYYAEEFRKLRELIYPDGEER